MVRFHADRASEDRPVSDEWTDEQVARAAQKMTTTAQWLLCEEHAKQTEKRLGRMDPDMARRIVAYRDKVAAGLNTCQRRALHGDPYMRRPKMLSALGEWGGFASAYFQPSDFGREVARVLEVNRG